MGAGHDRMGIVGSRSGPEGQSLADLVATGAQHGLVVAAVKGAPELGLPVPSVAHLRDGHYVALVAMLEAHVQVYDTGVKETRWICRREFKRRLVGGTKGDWFRGSVLRGSRAIGGQGAWEGRRRPRTAFPDGG